MRSSQKNFSVLSMDMVWPLVASFYPKFSSPTKLDGSLVRAQVVLTMSDMMYVLADDATGQSHP